MPHGRDHEEREQKLPWRRTVAREPDDEREAFEAEEVPGGTTALVDYDLDEVRAVEGAHPPGEEHAAVDRGPAGGSTPAPTDKAARREAERHRLERERGHIAAGTGGYKNQQRPPDVTREDLDEIGEEADEKIAGHAIEDVREERDRMKENEEAERIGVEEEAHPTE